MTINYLINVADLKSLGLIHDNTDTKVLAVLIRDMQEMQIQSVTGTPLFRELLRRVEDDDWDAAYRKLMDDYVLPCLVSWVDYEAALFVNTKITNKNVGKGSDENRTANTTSETNVFQNRMLSRADFRSNRLIGFLQDNEDIYEEYKESGCYQEWVAKRTKKNPPIKWVL
jgi:hypothetical protein